MIGDWWGASGRLAGAAGWEGTSGRSGLSGRAGLSGLDSRDGCVWEGDDLGVGVMNFCNGVRVSGVLVNRGVFVSHEF